MRYPVLSWWTVAGIVLALLTASAHTGHTYDAATGSVVIDGDLSDWDAAVWSEAPHHVPLLELPGGPDDRFAVSFLKVHQPNPSAWWDAFNWSHSLSSVTGEVEVGPKGRLARVPEGRSL